MLNWLLLLFTSSVIEANERIYISSIVPNTGPLTGNTRVIVRGKNLQPNDEYPIPLCKFGRKSNIVRGTYVTCTPLPRNPDDPEPTTIEKTDHCIICDPSPAGIENDMIPFLVSITGDFSDIENSVEFQYYTPPSVSYIVPMYGQKDGGTVVTVYGQNFIDFDQYLRCFFGSKAVPGIFISSSIMHCISPPSDIIVSAVSFRVTLNDQQTTKETVNYYYYPEPAISKLTPNYGPTTGGTSVEIEGQSLDPFNDMLSEVNNHNDTFCRFGRDILVLATIVSDAKIICVAPPSQFARTYFVDVTLNNADMVLNEIDWTDDHLQYSYFAPAYIYSVEPSIGPKGGNTSVIVNGNNFNNTSNIKCKFGSKVVPGTFLSTYNVSCLTPFADNPGPVDLSISLGDDNFGNAIRYTYYAIAQIGSISPTCGPRTGYTQITVTGTNFASYTPGKVKCIFGGIEQTDATIISDTEIRCDSPDIHLKNYQQTFFNFSVSLNGNDQSTAAIMPQFAFYDFHTLTDMNPKFGPLEGSTQSYVYGSGFAQKGVCNVTVRFGASEVSVVSYNDTIILVNSPEVGNPGTSIVQVSLNGQQFTDYAGPRNIGGSKFDSKIEYLFYEAPLTTGFHPLGGPSSGNSIINIFGAGFGEEGDVVYVRFKYNTNSTVFAVITCEDVDLNKIQCYSPRANPNSVAILELSRNGQNYQKIADYTYLFYDSPTITSLQPNMGPVKNEVGGNITVTGTKFACATSSCDQLTCRYGTSPYPLYMNGYFVDKQHVLCPIISYSRPEVIQIEVAMNGIDFTNNNMQYTFFDAFVLNAEPKYFTEKGGTVLSVLGFGFANTSSELLCKMGSASNPLLCNGTDCIFPGIYISDTEIHCIMPPRNIVTYKNNGTALLYETFAIEISIKNNVFTTSNIQVMYSEDAVFLSISQNSGSANGWAYLIIETEFYWETQDMDEILKYSEVKCRFYTNITEIYMDGSIIAYPFESTGDPNAIACLTPPWPTSETVNISITINGKDFGRSFTYHYVDKVSVNLLTPSCGPNGGATKVSIQGNGYNDLSGYHLKWGTESIPASTETLFTDTSGYITGYSPATRNNYTHGGFVYVEIGHNVELETADGSNYTISSEYTHNKLLYYYYKEPTLDYLYPRGGSNNGGTVVTLSGSWFINFEAVSCTPRIRFGNSTIIPGEFINTVKIRCISPPQAPNDPEIVNVEISFNGID